MLAYGAERVALWKFFKSNPRKSYENHSVQCSDTPYESGSIGTVIISHRTTGYRPSISTHIVQYDSVTRMWHELPLFLQPQERVDFMAKRIKVLARLEQGKVLIVYHTRRDTIERWDTNIKGDVIKRSPVDRQSADQVYPMISEVLRGMGIDK